ncbi:MAG: hypothetical protein KGJ57_19830 [Sphingomonadales bacterium]|nr:hypothetical protein [Sphingomonadales bacterium]MDE2171645.1 hypothetical protein [Sphingomonadales bacterium]
MPAAAMAAGDGQDAREAALVGRLEKLEAELTRLRADLATLHQAQASVQTQTAAQAAGQSVPEQGAQASTAAPVRMAQAAGVAQGEAKKAPASQAGDGHALGFHNGNTLVTLSGYVKLLASSAGYSGGDDPTNTLGRDLYLPQSVPVFNPARPTMPVRVTDFSAKQTRFWVDASTRLGKHDLKAYIEFDFQAAPGTPMALGQGTQRTTNAYDLAMRRAFIRFDRWTLGQDFSNFGMVEALPESTDYVGGVDGIVFVRQPILRYSLPLSKALTLHVAAENPETASATVGSAAMIENGQDHAPDMSARLSYAAAGARLDVSTMIRQLRVDNQPTYTASGALATPHIQDSRVGWGVNASGKIFLNASHRSDIRFEATYGEGMGRYLGLNFAPDAVLMANGQLSSVRNLGLYGSAHIALDAKWRINLIGSFQRDYYVHDIDRSAAGIGTYNEKAWSAAANLFYSPVRNIDLGVEYRRGNRMLVNGLSGQVDRIDAAAKYTF